MAFIILEHVNLFIYCFSPPPLGPPGGSSSKESCWNAGATGDAGSIPGSEDPLEEEMATGSSILAWEIPWTEEPGGLHSLGLQRVGHH